MVAQQTDTPNELVTLVGPFWSATKTAEALGVTPDVLATMADADEVLGLVTADLDTVYPVWQFQRRAETNEVKPNLIPVFQALSGYDGWTVAVFLHTPTSRLGPATSLDWLAQGGPSEAVIDLAEIVAREWRAGAARVGPSQSKVDTPSGFLK